MALQTFGAFELQIVIHADIFFQFTAQFGVGKTELTVGNAFAVFVHGKEIRIGDKIAFVTQFRQCGKNSCSCIVTSFYLFDTRRNELEKAFSLYVQKFACGKRLFIGCGQGDFTVECTIPDSPLRLIRHMAVKLVLNNISTGTMVVLGRVTGNWMSWVDCTNKKLMDRGTRLVAEIGNLSYEESCEKLFEALEIIASTTPPGAEKQSAVQYVLERL